MKKKEFNTLEDKFDVICEYLESRLPHGSGIDCKWEFDYQSNGKVLARNSWHCMNDVGYYDGWADFTIKFDLHKPMNEFVLQFNGKVSHYKANKYFLRDYLEESIYYSLTDDSVFSIISK